MDILHTVEFYNPSIGGAQEVVRQISERLVKKGHSVTVATSQLKERTFREYNGVKIRDFNIKGNFVNGFTGEIDQYREFVLDSDFDIMMNYAAQQWTTDLVLPILDEIKMKKIIVPCGFSNLCNVRYTDYFEKMKSWLGKYDACVYLSSNYRDFNFAKSVGLTNDRIIPNGSSAEEFETNPKIDIRTTLGIPSDHLLILLVGSHTGLKGHDQAMKIFQKTRCKKSTLLIVGNNSDSVCGKKCRLQSHLLSITPKSLISDKRIVVKSLSREETIAAFLQADIFLFPSMIECSPIVLFEAMASKTPFLTTDVGNAREIVERSNGGLLLPTLKTKSGMAHAKVTESARLLDVLASDEKARLEYGKRGHSAWRKDYTWETIAGKYESLYSELLVK